MGRHRARSWGYSREPGRGGPRSQWAPVLTGESDNKLLRRGVSDGHRTGSGRGLVVRDARERAAEVATPTFGAEDRFKSESVDLVSRRRQQGWKAWGPAAIARFFLLKLHFCGECGKPNIDQADLGAKKGGDRATGACGSPDGGTCEPTSRSARTQPTLLPASPPRRQQDVSFPPRNHGHLLSQSWARREPRGRLRAAPESGRREGPPAFLRPRPSPLCACASA